MTGAELRARAAAWLAREVEAARRRMGPAWIQHAGWVLDYLRAEAAERIGRLREVRR